MYTSVAGISLTTGITDQVHEVQMVTMNDCLDQNVSITVGLPFNNPAKSVFVIGSELATNLRTKIRTLFPGDDSIAIGVERSVDVNFALTSKKHSQMQWKVTFLGLGDVAPLLVSSPVCAVYVETLLQGNRNQFIIEPKIDSGGVLTDVGEATEYSGKDVFFTGTFLPYIFLLLSTVLPANY